MASGLCLCRVPRILVEPTRTIPSAPPQQELGVTYWHGGAPVVRGILWIPNLSPSSRPRPARSPAPAVEAERKRPGDATAKVAETEFGR